MELIDIRIVVQEATQPLQTEVRRVQNTLEERQRSVVALDHHIDELDAGLDKRILQRLADVTPPQTPRATAIPAGEPPGLQTAFSSAKPASSLTQKQQRTVVIWG